MSAPLRVLLLTETFFPEIGGGEAQARMLSSALAERGHDVVLITRRSRPGLPHDEVSEGVRILRIGPAGQGRWRKWGLTLTVIPPLLRLCRDFDVVLVSGYRILGMPAVLIARLFRRASVLKADSTGEMSGTFYAAGLAKLRLHMDSPPVRLLVGGRNLLLRRADAFVAMSTDIAGELRSCGVPEARIVHVPNGVDTDRFRPAGPTERRRLRDALGLPTGPIVIYTGRLVSYKGLPLLLRAWRCLMADVPHATLVLVGAGGADMHNCEEDLRHYVSRHELDGSVRFTGAVDNVEEYLQASDIFVFPTENEAFGISLIEAMACGLPVVATAVGGIPDFLVHGVNGIMVAPGDRTELHQALADLLSDDGQVARVLGTSARASVVEQFSKEAVADSYVHLFRRVLSTRSPEPSA